MTRLRDIYGPGFTQDQYLRALRAGHETGWWDEHGVPAPWPEDFLDPHRGWTCGSSDPDTDPQQHNGDEPPF
jgi:hypothetical protein